MNNPDLSKSISSDILYQHEINCKSGRLILIADSEALILCDWSDSKHFGNHIKEIVKYYHKPFLKEANPIIKTAVSEIELYLSGYLKSFSLPLNPFGTAFQKKVWEVLCEIPYGSVTYYENIAERTGDVRKVRAVANAISMNPISILIPCHRVIRKDGSLGGYAGGIVKKELLLELEKKNGGK